MANWINNYDDLEAVTANGQTIIMPHTEVQEDDVYIIGLAVITGKILLEQRDNQLNT